MSETINVGVPHPISRRDAARQQIEAAIELFDGRRSEAAAITLALAAEDQLPEPTDGKTSLFQILKARNTGPDKMDANRIRNWLKHHKEPDQIGISELDVVFSILRAVSKYLAVYDDRDSESMKAFTIWVRNRGYFDGNVSR
ncbi:hypothetical protein [Beijerinckia sp. L45]|uniref:hypothetical protein n=1 Tax=Beijerinckia sp. L45 TaxID=1641855 RepID=UPI00131E4354|nr:hypothetical protein [Beijerinckia sp. L45]